MNAFEKSEMKKLCKEVFKLEPEYKDVIEDAFIGDEQAIAVLIDQLHEHGQHDAAKLWEEQYKDDTIVQDFLKILKEEKFSELWKGFI